MCDAYVRVNEWQSGNNFKNQSSPSLWSAGMELSWSVLDVSAFPHWVMPFPSKDGLDDLSALYRWGSFYILRSLQHLKSGVDLFATGVLWFPILEHSMGIIFYSDQLELKGVVSHMTRVLEPELRSFGSAESAVSFLCSLYSWPFEHGFWGCKPGPHAC